MPFKRFYRFFLFCHRRRRYRPRHLRPLCRLCHHLHCHLSQEMKDERKKKTPPWKTKYSAVILNPYHVFSEHHKSSNIKTAMASSDFKLASQRSEQYSNVIYIVCVCVRAWWKKKNGNQQYTLKNFVVTINKCNTWKSFYKTFDCHGNFMLEFSSKNIRNKDSLWLSVSI